ncbi:SLATT domain-containing protein [Streptomyces sp. MUM 136J]|uniref:SLATT domain-containing protein n=1 Tax=Streptomyces sp. MUM 136J TaxID=2791992 RepID=UPI001F0335B5|nr:SLATT domain-containing protein [Streptomyces sp. MUM 136J]MCH0571339.1 SLATT domain-containing protein [Streptomyces sp. MUM 136J]
MGTFVRRRAGDMTVNELAELDRSRTRADLLLELFRHAENEVIGAIGWYLEQRRRPAVWSRTLRALAALLGIAGTITPLVHAAVPAAVQPEWGFVFLAGGAGCVLFDRIFGFSASWTRYIRSELALQQILKKAQAEWAQTYLRITDSPSDKEQAALLGVIERLRTDGQRILEEESRAWMGYLADGIEELTRSTTPSAGQRPGPAGMLRMDRTTGRDQGTDPATRPRTSAL